MCWVFAAARAFSSCGKCGYSLVAECRLLIVVAFLVVEGEWALGHVDFSSSGSPALEHRLSICGGMGLVALRHVGSSWIRDQTCVSWIGRWILYH